jgi:hypothetical protein
LKYIRNVRGNTDNFIPRKTQGSESHSETSGTSKTIGGVSETTQDVAYRRKIIMDALVDSCETSLIHLENFILHENDEEKYAR